MTAIINLTLKSTEERTKRILHENKMTPMHIIPGTGDKASIAYRDPNWKARVKDKNEALPLDPIAITRPGAYKIGDGDFNTTVRIGADDHKKYKSLSTRGDVIYPRDHK